MSFNSNQYNFSPNHHKHPKNNNFQQDHLQNIQTSNGSPYNNYILYNKKHHHYKKINPPANFHENQHCLSFQKPRFLYAKGEDVKAETVAPDKRKSDEHDELIEKLYVDYDDVAGEVMGSDMAVFANECSVYDDTNESGFKNKKSFENENVFERRKDLTLENNYINGCYGKIRELENSNEPKINSHSLNPLYVNVHDVESNFLWSGESKEENKQRQNKKCFKSGTNEKPLKDGVGPERILEEGEFNKNPLCCEDSKRLQNKQAFKKYTPKNHTIPLLNNAQLKQGFKMSESTKFASLSSNMETEIAALNTEMDRIKRQYFEIVQSHREAQLSAFPEEWIDQNEPHENQIELSILKPFHTSALKTKRRHYDKSSRVCSRPSTNHVTQFSNSSNSSNQNYIFHSSTINKIVYQSANERQNLQGGLIYKQKGEEPSNLPRVLDSFSNLNLQNDRRMLPKMGTRQNLNICTNEVKPILKSGVAKKVTKNVDRIRNSYEGIKDALSTLNAVCLENEVGEGVCEINQFEESEPFYCALHVKDLKTQYETLQFKMKHELSQDKKYTCNKDIYDEEKNENLYHVLETTKNNQNKMIFNNNIYTNVFKSGDRIFTNNHEGRESHSDLEHPLENNGFVKEWNSDGDEEEDTTPQKPQTTENFSYNVHKQNKIRYKKMCVKRYINYKRKPHILSQSSSFREIFVDGFLGSGEIGTKVLKAPVDLKCTDPHNLPHNINLQQQLFKHQRKFVRAENADMQAYQTGRGDPHLEETPKKKTEALKLEWVVKKRADGSRYITRRQVRSKVLKKRSKQVAGCGMTTDDDALSAMREGGHLSRKERKKHFDQLREHKRQRECLLRQLAEKKAAMIALRTSSTDTTLKAGNEMFVKNYIIDSDKLLKKQFSKTKAVYPKVILKTV